jgi:hypothetical protein
LGLRATRKEKTRKRNRNPAAERARDRRRRQAARLEREELRPVIQDAVG